MFQHKSQTATEYLIILAVVIIIALIVVGVLGGIPSIGGGVSENQLNVIAQTYPIGITDLSVSCYHTVLNLRNNIPNSITLLNFTMNNRTCTFQDSSLNFALGSQKQLVCYGVQNCRDSQFSYDFTYFYRSADAIYELSGEYSGKISSYAGNGVIQIGEYLDNQIKLPANADLHFFINPLMNDSFATFDLDEIEGWQSSTSFGLGARVLTLEGTDDNSLSPFYFDSDPDPCTPAWKNVLDVCSNETILEEYLIVDRNSLGNDSYWDLPEGFIFLGSGDIGEGVLTEAMKFRNSS